MCGYILTTFFLFSFSSVFATAGNSDAASTSVYENGYKGCVEDGGPGFENFRSTPCNKIQTTDSGDTVVPVVCDPGGWITELHLSECINQIPTNNTLLFPNEANSNKIVNAISKLRNITHIGLGQTTETALIAAIPDDWGTLPYLKTLLLQNNAFYGDFPVSFSNSETLETLVISGNKLKSFPKQLGVKNTALKTVVASGNQFGNTGNCEFPWGLTHAQSIETIIMRSSGLGSGCCLNCSFGGNTKKYQIKIPSNLTALTALKVLDLSGNKFTGSIPPFTAVSSPSLTALRLSNNLLSGTPTVDILSNVNFMTPTTIYDSSAATAAGGAGSPPNVPTMQSGLFLDSNFFSGILMTNISSVCSDDESVCCVPPTLGPVVMKAIYDIPNSDDPTNHTLSPW